jgi:hypothetical protein
VPDGDPFPRWPAQRIPVDVLSLVSPAEAECYGAIRCYQDKKAGQFPSREMLAKKTGLSRRRITACIAELKRKGLAVRPQAKKRQPKALIRNIFRSPREQICHWCEFHGRSLHDEDWRWISARLRERDMTQFELVEVLRPHFEDFTRKDPVRLVKRLATQTINRSASGAC